MTRKFSETGKPFKRPAAKHGGHIGSGPPPGPKKSVNLRVDAEFLAVAKELGINLSQVLENELRKLTEDARIEKWKRENKAHIDSYNALIERAGVFGEEFQDWDEPSV